MESELSEVHEEIELAYKKFDEIGVKRPGASDSSTSTSGLRDPDAFSFTTPQMGVKLMTWAKERSVCSREESIKSIPSVMVEFFPNGVEASYPGYCALRLHIPDKTRIKWGIYIGSGPLFQAKGVLSDDIFVCGERSDDFSQVMMGRSNNPTCMKDPAGKHA